MPKKVLIALPPAMLEQVDYIAQCEHRTRSDLIRESLRRYLDNFRHRNQPQLTVMTRKEEPINVPNPKFTSIPDNGRDFFSTPAPGSVPRPADADNGSGDTQPAADGVYQGPIIG